MAPPRILSGFLFLVIVAPQVFSLHCLTYDGPCKCTTEQGLIDLSPLDSKTGAK